MLTGKAYYDHIVTMYIRTTKRQCKGKTYTNYLLVESLHTPKGPRQKVICSLGDLICGCGEIAAQLPLAHKEPHRASLYEKAFGRSNSGCGPTAVPRGEPYGLSSGARTIADFAWVALCLPDANGFACARVPCFTTKGEATWFACAVWTVFDVECL